MAERQHRSTTFQFTRHGSQLFLDGFPVLGMPDRERDTKYFSLNPFLPNERNRCPLACAYCVCHQDGAWHHHPERYSAPIDDDALLDALLDVVLESDEGRRGAPISLCDYSDPFIPAHRERVLAILNRLIDRGAANLVYITSKVFPGERYLDRLAATLARPHRLRPTVFVSLPPLRPGYEPASVPGRVRLVKELARREIPACWYLRPLVEEWYDEELLRRLARELLPHVAHHVILSGIVMSEEIVEHLQLAGLTVPGWNPARSGKKQHLSREFEGDLRGVLSEVAGELGLDLGPVMGHRLCGVNGNHAYGCLLCARQDRFCKLFQQARYGETVEIVDSDRLQRLLAEQRAELAACEPSAEACG